MFQFKHHREDVCMTFITETERKTPVISETDVIVAGGGVAGVAAALAASRNGAKVLLIERYGQLGGLATGGLVTLLLGYGRYECGINREIGEYLLQNKEILNEVKNRDKN